MNPTQHEDPLLSTAETGTVGAKDRPTVISSFSLPEVLRVQLADLPGIVELRLLALRNPKLFVVIERLDFDLEMRIIDRLIAVEDVLPSSVITYDIIPADRLGFVPVDAKRIDK